MEHLDWHSGPHGEWRAGGGREVCVCATSQTRRARTDVEIPVPFSTCSWNMEPGFHLLAGDNSVFSGDSDKVKKDIKIPMPGVPNKWPIQITTQRSSSNKTIQCCSFPPLAES